MEQVSDERYQEKAALRQASSMRKKASATQEKVLIIVHTGPGKGKTDRTRNVATHMILSLFYRFSWEPAHPHRLPVITALQATP